MTRPETAARAVGLDDVDFFTDNRRYSYLPTFTLRGLTRLHIEFS